MFNEIYNKIKEFDTIIIHRHQKPDGDAIGAQIGLKYAILATFSNKEIYVVGDNNERYNLFGVMDEINDSVYDGALAIVLDSGAEYLISDDRYKMAKFVIKIDHHIPQGEYGDLAYVDTSAESTAGIIARFMKSMKMVLSKDAAEALFLGIVSDSGRFRFSSVSPNTFKMASYLLGARIDIDKIYNAIYLEELKNVKLKAELTLKFKTTPTGIAYLKNTYQEVIAYGTNPYHISRGMVNIMGGINGIYIWANFTEDERGKILVELRSSSANINQVAVKYGGGGHLQASGAYVDNFEVVDLIIADLEKVLENNNE